MGDDEAEQLERLKQVVAVLLARVPIPPDPSVVESRWVEDRQETDPHGLY
jgi:hypothetical protein